MHEQEVDHDVMTPSAANHGGTHDFGKPTGGDFEVKTELALRIGGDERLQMLQAGRKGAAVAIVAPAFGCELRQIAGFFGAVFHFRLPLKPW